MAAPEDDLPTRGGALRRAAQIANVLFRQGFEGFVERTPLARFVTPECRTGVAQACRCVEEGGACPCGHALPIPQRLTNTIIELGPTFIKLGQIASTRPDLIPPVYSEALRTLQEHVPPFPLAHVRRLVEKELNRPLDDAFAEFESQPVASASLSQVHFAVLPHGVPVAVKVQRPGIEQVIERDLAILRWLARQASRVDQRLRELQPEQAIEEFGRWTLKELDFETEGRNYDEFRRNFKDRDDVSFPRIYWTHSTRRLLTMERVSGLRLHEVTPALHAQERLQLARRLAEVELQMFVADGFFHADLHPGNIFFQPDGRIVILDVGMVGRMPAEIQDRFLCYWIAITRRQRARALHHLLKMALSTDGADLDAFRTRYEHILDVFYGAPLARRSLAKTYLDILLAGAEAGVRFPPDMLLQAKAVVTAEALDLVLYPQFRFSEEARPIVAREVARRATPGAVLDRLWTGVAEFLLLGELPPTGAAASGDVEDERQFRNEVIRALAYAWAESADGELRTQQSRLGHYASAEYWRDHPELHAALQTAAGMLHVLAMLIARALEAAESAQARAQEHAATEQRGANAPRWPDDFRRMAEYGENQLRGFASDDFWRDQPLLQAAASAALGVSRLLASQVAQAAAERTSTSESPASDRDGLDS